jgi:hypothetical protein
VVEKRGYNMRQLVPARCGSIEKVYHSIWTTGRDVSPLLPRHQRTHLSRIGFDVILIHSTKPSVCIPSEAAQYTESDLRLRDGEKQNFARRNGGTNKLTKRTLSADELIGEVIDSNNSFIPIAVGPYGEFGSLFRPFLHGINPLPLPSFCADGSNALRAAEIVSTKKNPLISVVS